MGHMITCGRRMTVLTWLILVATQLLEINLPEDKVLEKLNKVSTAKRQAYMVSVPLPDMHRGPNIAAQELYDTKFGKREKINKVKTGQR